MNKRPELHDAVVAARLASAVAAFDEVGDHVQAAASRIRVVNYDLSIHYAYMVDPAPPQFLCSLRNLPDDVRLRAFKAEAPLLISHLDAVTAKLRRARAKLLEVSGGVELPPEDY